MLAKFLETNTTLIRLQLSVTDDIELPELAAVAAILQRNKVGGSRGACFCSCGLFLGCGDVLSR